MLIPLGLIYGDWLWEASSWYVVSVGFINLALLIAGLLCLGWGISKLKLRFPVPKRSPFWSGEGSQPEGSLSYRRE